MARIYLLEDCGTCPECVFRWMAGEDPMERRVLCRLVSYREIAADHPFDIVGPPIPDWCPLPEDTQPDLLAACEAAHEWAASFPLGIATTEADRLAAEDVFRKTQAAIAKAKG